MGHDRPLMLRHLPVLERPVYIEIRPKRYRCPYCSDHPTTTQRCSWYEPNSPHTRAFEQQVMRSLIHSTVSDVSRKERVGAEAVEGILNRRVAQAVDWASLKALGVLGRDEIALKKGHRDFVTIVSAQPPGGALTVLAVLPDRCKETVKGFLACIALSDSRPPSRGCAPTGMTVLSTLPGKCCRTPAWWSTASMSPKLELSCADQLREPRDQAAEGRVAQCGACRAQGHVVAVPQTLG